MKGREGEMSVQGRKKKCGVILLLRTRREAPQDESSKQNVDSRGNGKGRWGRRCAARGDAFNSIKAPSRYQITRGEQRSQKVV